MTEVERARETIENTLRALAEGADFALRAAIHRVLKHVRPSFDVLVKQVKVHRIMCGDYPECPICRPLP